MANQIYDERTPYVWPQPFNSYTPGTLVDLVPTASYIRRVDQLWLNNYDSVPHDISVLWNDGANSYSLIDYTVPAGDGVGNVGTWVEILSKLFPSSEQFLMVPAGWKLQIVDHTAVTAAGANAWASGGAF